MFPDLARSKTVNQVVGIRAAFCNSKILVEMTSTDSAGRANPPPPPSSHSRAFSCIRTRTSISYSIVTCPITVTHHAYLPLRYVAFSRVISLSARVIFVRGGLLLSLTCHHMHQFTQLVEGSVTQERRTVTAAIFHLYFPVVTYSEDMENMCEHLFCHFFRRNTKKRK